MSIVVAPPIHSGPWTEFKSNRPNNTINMIVIHAIAELIIWPHVPANKVGAVTWLTSEVPGRTSGVSAHRYIAVSGLTWNICEENKKAWHAGISKWGNETNLNNVSLGVELGVAGTHDYSSFVKAIKKEDCYSNAQYLAVGWVVHDWMSRYNINRDRVVGHDQISGDHVRGHGKGKKDPGAGFNWDRMWEIVDAWEAKG